MRASSPPPARSAADPAAARPLPGGGGYADHIHPRREAEIQPRQQPPFFQFAQHVLGGSHGCGILAVSEIVPRTAIAIAEALQGASDGGATDRPAPLRQQIG